MVESLNKTSTSYSMEIRAEKTKLMTSNRNGIATDIRTRGEKLETVNKFKYLGTVVSDEGSKPEIMSRIAQTSVAIFNCIHHIYLFSISNCRLPHRFGGRRSKI